MSETTHRIDKRPSRIDIIGQNGGDGAHYSDPTPRVCCKDGKETSFIKCDGDECTGSMHPSVWRELVKENDGE